MSSQNSGQSSGQNSGKGVRVTLVKSVHGQLHRHRATASGLGLRRMNQSVVVADTPENRGMINASRHLFRVEEV